METPSLSPPGRATIYNDKPSVNTDSLIGLTLSDNVLNAVASLSDKVSTPDEIINVILTKCNQIK